MPDFAPDQTPTTPGQLLAGPPPNTSNMALYSRPGQPPSLQAPQQQQPQAPQQQPAQPTPQMAVAARHHDIGKTAAFLFGRQQDPATGEPIKQRPGDVFKSLLLGAMLGSSLASEGGNAGGGSVGGFLGGMGRGASGVEQQAYQRQQQAQTNAQHKQEMTLEQQKFDEEKMQHASTLEHWNLENLARGREADYRDREQLQKENETDLNIQKWAVDNGAFLAPTVPNNGVPGNGPSMMAAMTKNPAAFNPPAGMGRLLVKKYDFDRLDHDSKNGWTEDGKPVDWSKHLTWSVYYAPSNPTDKAPISMSGADWHRLYGVNFPPGSDPQKMYNVKAVAPLITVATGSRKQDREDANQSFKEKHDALNATINAARTNVTQYNSEKRELIRQGYAEDDDEVQEIEKKIEGEQKREQDAIGEMHPKIRERVNKQSPGAPAQTAVKAPKGPTSATLPDGSTVKVGDTVPLKDGRKVKVTAINPDGKGFSY
jgi:hypothetical protein